MHYTWDWGVLIRAPYGEWLLTGAGWSLALTLVAWTIALLVGSVVGCLRSAGSRLLRLPATLFVELFRNVPPLVQLFLWFYAFPEILPTALGMWVKRDLPLPSFSTASVAIGLFAAARVAEQVRAGIGSVRARLLPAALATGMRPWQAYRLVLLPVAFRIIMAPLTSEFLITFKMSSIALTIGVLEVSAQAQQISNYTFHGFEAYAAATVFYLAVGLVITLLMGRLDRRMRRGVGAGGRA
jgi:glutamate/aspartate transport system permease protein